MSSASESRISDVLARLSLREKVDLLSGRDMNSTPPLPRLGIGSLLLTDGPHGVRASDAVGGRTVGKTTGFPTGVSFAASWNPDLVGRVGQALGEETLAMGCDVLLGPCINIHRHPLGGRNFESYAEDPWLAGRIGVAYVKGVQSRGVGASVKHFACNNQEKERWRGNAIVDERTLREIYLPAFEAVVAEARPWTVMCAYNRINGAYGSQNRHLLSEILKGEWGFDGVVVSDWNATHATAEPVKAGLDLEMPGPAKFFGRLLYEAVLYWQVEGDELDAAARRMLRLIDRCGRLGAPGRPAARKRGGSVGTPAHHRLARELAEEAMVLLKNDGAVLPLDASAMGTLAVIGPQADRLAVGGGSSWVDSPYRVTPLEGLERICGKRIRIVREQGCDNHVDMPVVPHQQLRPVLAKGKVKGKGHGATVTYFDGPGCAGAPVGTAIDRDISRWTWMEPPHPGVADWRRWSARFECWYTPDASALHRIQLDIIGGATLWIDGRQIIDAPMWDPLGSDPVFRKLHHDMRLERGRSYRVRIDYTRIIGTDDGTLVKFQAGPSPVEATYEREIAAAAEAAARCDAAVVFVGLPERFEGEEFDRPHLELPGRQAELIRAVCSANPRTAVVLQCGSPVTMPWLDAAPALLLAWYPGMEGGNAIARALFGLVDPSGRLPMTFPRRLEDTPAFGSYPGIRESRYAEGVFVGYRHYDARGIEPLFPFGHGLSYTRFAYSALRVPERARRGAPVTVSVAVRNIGARAGAEVVQLYVGDTAASLPRPPLELKRFAKIALRPGERRVVRFELDERAFAFFDPVRKAWVVEPGEFTIVVGASSRDERARERIVLA